MAAEMNRSINVSVVNIQKYKFKLYINIDLFSHRWQ